MFNFQVTYATQGINKVNLTHFNLAFDSDLDPTRFLSIHCILYPDDVICQHTSSVPG